MKRFGDWDVDDEGLMSLQGVDKFPVYNAEGGITTRTVSLWLVGDKIEHRMNPDIALNELERIIKLEDTR